MPPWPLRWGDAIAAAVLEQRLLFRAEAGDGGHGRRK